MSLTHARYKQYEELINKNLDGERLTFIFDSYRWQRDGIQITLNIEVEGYISPTTDEEGNDIRGAKKLNYYVGINPHKVRRKLEEGHESSQEYEDPPQCKNELHRKMRKRKHENKIDVAWKRAKGKYATPIRERPKHLKRFIRLRFFTSFEYHE